MVNKGEIFDLHTYFSAGINEGGEKELYLQSSNEYCVSAIAQVVIKRNRTETELTVFSEDAFCIGE